MPAILTVTVMPVSELLIFWKVKNFMHGRVDYKLN